MRIYDLIAKKRDGGTHSREELEAIVNRSEEHTSELQSP